MLNMKTETTTTCTHLHNNNENENEEICKTCLHLNKIQQNNSLLQERRLKGTTKRNGLDRSLTINIPHITEKPPKVKRASSSVIRRSPNNKVLYRTLTPSCDVRKPLSMRPPTPYFNNDDDNNNNNNNSENNDNDDETNRRQFSFDEESLTQDTKL